MQLQKQLGTLDTVSVILGALASLLIIIGYLSGGMHKLRNLMKGKPREETPQRAKSEPMRENILSEAGGTPRTFKLATYKELYDFAFSTRGMGLTGPDARKWTEDWLKNYFDRDFETFKEYYRFASSVNGMGLIGSEARKWAPDKLLES